MLPALVWLTNICWLIELVKRCGPRSDAARSVYELVDVSRDVGRLYSRIEGSSRRPTEDQVCQLDEAWDEVPALIERLNAIIEEEMPALYRRLDELGIRPELGEPVEVPARPARP